MATSARNFYLAMAIGALPVTAAAAVAAWAMNAHSPAATSVDALTMAALGMLTYGFACVVLIPTLCTLAYFVQRRGLALTGPLTAAAFAAVCVLVLPILYVSAQ